MSNTSHVRGLRSTKFSWDHFDHGISQKTRDFLNFEAPTAVIVSSSTVNLSQRAIDDYLELCAKSTLAVYGPDHPQAWRDKRLDLSDIDDWTD